MAMSSAAVSSSSSSSPLPVDQFQPYPLISKNKISPDSYVLRFALEEPRTHLGFDPVLPTCLAIEYDDDKDDDKPLKKSYSPISHPSETDWFDLLVKEYPVRPGGGVGAYICDLTVGDTINAAVKKPRQIHGSPQVEGRWNHVGLIGGGTGIAPLYQLLVILLADSDCATISVLSIDRRMEDVLLKPELEELAEKYPDRVKITHSLTGDEQANDETCNSVNILSGRGDVEMARQALPPSTNDGKTMIFVCGKDGFVSTWGGPVGRAAPSPDGKKGKKIQGPLLGILKEAGYDESEVFKY